MSWGTFYAFLFPFLSMTVMFRLGVREALPASLLTSFFGGPCMTWIFLWLVPFTRRLPFWLAVLTQMVSILLVVAVGFFLSSLVIGSIGNQVTPFSMAAISSAFANLTAPHMIPAYVVALGLIIFMTAMGQIGAKLGPGVLWNWLIGKYHRPREEERIFMFLDVKDSTPLAEELGAVKFSALIQMFFRDVGDCLSDRKGAVSHFIGDEAVIFWKPEAGIKDANCIRFFFDLKEHVAERGDEYRSKFGVVPTFKAGVHIGPVVAAEVSAGKSEIVLHGDAVNTTARIVGMCAALQQDLLVSGELATRLKDAKFESLGEHELKGKSEPVEILTTDSQHSF